MKQYYDKLPMRFSLSVILLLISSPWLWGQAPGLWQRKADFSGIKRLGAVGFAINGKGYIGTGYDSDNYHKDLWAYDPDSGTWSQKADFGGIARLGAASFVIDNKAYVGTGVNSVVIKDFWAYDPVTNAWTRKADFGGPARDGTASFTLNDKGYVGTGLDENGDVLRDFWAYDPTTDSWSKKADFGGPGRYNAVGFAIGSKGYLGTGNNLDGNYYKDFWAYNPVSDTWERKADFGDKPRAGAVSFVIDNKGYVGTGYDGIYTNSLWVYDPSLNSWSRKADFGGTGRYLGTGFVLNGKGYLGTGYNANVGLFKDFWAYDPTAVCTNPTATVSGGGSVCDGATRPDVSITLTGTGPWAITYSDGTTSTTVPNINTNPYVISQAPAGTYTVSAVSGANCQGTGSGSATVSVKPLPSFDVATPTAVCSPNSVDLVNSVTNRNNVGKLSYYADAALSQRLNSSVVNASGTYYVQGELNGCFSQTKAVTATINPLPAQFNVTGGGSICQGSSGVAVGLENAQVGVLYVLRRGELNVASVVASQAGPINFGTYNTEGIYTVLASNTTGCEQLQTGSVSITVNNNPDAKLNNDGAITCLKLNSQLTASGGDNGAIYRIVGPNNFLQNGTGTGASVSSGGLYSLTVTNTTGCSATANNTVEENKTPPQTVQLGNGGGLTCIKTSTSLTPSSDMPTATFVLSGPSLSGNTATGPGQYTVTATNPANGCRATATTDVVQNIAPPTGVNLASSGTLSANTPTVTLTAASNITANVSVSYGFSPPAQQSAANQATVTSSGPYSVTATRSDNGCTATATATVLGAASTTACRGSSTTISLNVPGNPTRYEWYVGVATGQPLRDGSVYQGATTATLTIVSVSQSQVYYAKVYYTDGSSAVYGPYRATLKTNCGAREAATIEPGESTRGTELRITLMGNPLQGEALKAIVNGAAGQRLHLELVDQSGRSVRIQVFESAENQQAVEWNLNSAGNGLYLLQAVSGQQRHTVKVVKP